MQTCAAVVSAVLTSTTGFAAALAPDGPLVFKHLPFFARDINNRGHIVGSHDDDDDRRLGYFLRAGSFTTLDFPAGGFVEAVGINENDDVVGETGGGAFGVQAFLYGPEGFTLLDLPCGSLAAGINNKWQIVGDCGDVGFVLQGRVIR